MWGFIDEQGEVVIELNFDHAYDFSEGLALVKYGTKWGYIDAKGEFAIQPRFDKGWSFKGELARVFVDGQMGYINNIGTLIWPAEQN